MNTREVQRKRIDGDGREVGDEMGHQTSCTYMKLSKNNLIFKCVTTFK